MNVLILSCGTRVSLIKYFKQQEEIDNVIVTDCSELAPALYFADKYFLVPRMKEQDYFPSLLKICEDEKISFIIPLQEDELILVAKNKSQFEKVGSKVIVSDYDKIMLCKDKYELNKFLKGKNIPAVKTSLAEDFLAKEEEFGEVFVKPRFGAGSVNTMPVHNKTLLECLLKEYEEELIVQPNIHGKEYGVDIYVDLLSKQVISCFVKEKLRMRSGETEKSVSVKNVKIQKLAISAVKTLGLFGPIDIDIMEHDGIFEILEINPRFGGGYPHAYACGINVPKYIAQNILGNTNIENILGYEENVVAMKYTDLLTLDGDV